MESCTAIQNAIHNSMQVRKCNATQAEKLQMFQRTQGRFCKFLLSAIHDGMQVCKNKCFWLFKYYFKYC